MASLIDELTDVLEKELECYRQLLPITESKTRIIIKNDLQALSKVTGEEQNITDDILALEKKRGQVVSNIATVINRPGVALKVSDIVKMIEKQPKERDRLARVHDQLKDIVTRLQKVNAHNKDLIEQSLELIEFNMNFIQSTRMSPGNNNYNKAAASMLDAGSVSTGMFDARQ